MSETVILVHGFAGGPFAMRALERRLRARGYEVVNWGYPSLRGSLDHYASLLAEVIAKVEGRVHLVGHSMGAVLVRKALLLGCPETVGRVVLMSPPFRGSKMADRLRWILRPLAPLALEMKYAAEAVIEPLPGHVEVGVIAARFDHIVSSADTAIAGHKEHMVVNWTHTLTVSPRAIKAAAEFIARGRFG